MPDWTQKLPRPIKAGGKTLRTLSDVATFLREAPEEWQAWPRWQHATRMAISAADGERDPFDVVIAFELGGRFTDFDSG